MAGPLQGLVVFELAEGVAGPYCGRLLSGLGATVVKVEPPEGDRSRRAGPFPGDVPDPEKSALFLHLNTGKQSVVAPWDEVRDRLHEADILLTEGGPKALASRGIDLDVVLRDFPRLVVCNVSWFGLTGPYADYEGSELVCYALSGYSSLTGAPDRKPLKAYGDLLQYQTGAHAALGTMAAITARAKNGAGQLVDVSTMEAGTFLLGGVEQTAYFYGWAPKRNGTRLLGFPPEHSYPSTIRPCKDGYVHCHSNNRNLELLGALIGDERLFEPELLRSMMGHADVIDEAMEPYLMARTRDEVVDEAQEIRLPFTPVRTPGEVVVEPHHQERGSFVTIDHPGAGPTVQPGTPIRFEKTPWQNRPSPTLGSSRLDGLLFEEREPLAPGRPAPFDAKRPLAGVRVVDFTNAVAGPMTTSLLGTLGAEIIKVETPNGRPAQAAGTAPLAEGSPDHSWDRMMLFNSFNHGKNGSLILDLNHPAGREALLKLVAMSDVFVQNFSPGVMPKLRLTYDDLKAANDQIIMISMPAFGLSGPWRDRRSYGPGIDAMAGLSHLTGYPDGPPVKPGNFFCDQNAAIHSAFAAVCALHHRRLSGEGQHVELAMVEGEMQILADSYMDHVMNGRERMRKANDHDWMAPHDIYPCRDEDTWVAIAVANDEQFRALCSVIERPELADDARFSTAEARHEHRRELDEPISAWTRARTPYEAQEALQAVGVPAGASLDAVMLFENPHVQAREGLQFVATDGVGPTPYPRPAFRLGGTPVPLANPAPPFGSANSYVFRDLLRMSEEEIAALYEQGVSSDLPTGTGGH